jgi:glycosyltransferase involved in cell wall biosynthesis
VGLVRGRGLVRPLFSRDRGLDVFQPVVPFPIERQRRRNARLIELQLKWASRRYPAPHVVLDARLSPEVRTPWAAARICVLKDHNPEGAELWNRDPQDVHAIVVQALAAADRRYAVSQALATWVSDHGYPDCAVIPHGWAPDTDSSETAIRMEGVERPILLFAGRLDGRLDFEALSRLAEAGMGSVVTLGPWLGTADRSVRDHPGIHVLDEVPSEQVGPFLRSADCLLLPYRSNEWSRYGFPAKLYEYLAAGPPIVASGYESLRTFEPPLVHFAADGDLLDATASALAEDRAVGREARQACARMNPWSARARDLMALVEDL